MIISPKNQRKIYAYSEIFDNLKKLFNSGKFPNKIIFSGNKGIGKCTLAYHVSNYILSKNEPNSYISDKNEINIENRSFILAKKNSHPNLYLIELKDDKKNIEISQIRKMIDYTNKSSFNNDYKIIIIDNVENLNINSVNALLKIVEEPNDKVLFLLVHNSNKKISDTLKSRCISFNLYLNEEDKEKIVNSILGNGIYNDISIDFKNYYSSPGDIINLYNFCSENKIDLTNSDIENFLKFVVQSNNLKNDTYIKNNLSHFMEIFFSKNILLKNSIKKNFYMYKYFVKKMNLIKKYNLDLESLLIEFNSKSING